MKIIASTGTREGGLAWTGVIAMNTANQEIVYTDNTRGTNFRGNVVIDAICAPDSLQCTHNVSVGGALTVAQMAMFDGAVVLGSTLTCGEIKSIGTPGVKIQKSDGNIALRIYDAEITQFYSNVIVDGGLTVVGTVSCPNIKPFWVSVLIGRQPLLRKS